MAWEPPENLTLTCPEHQSRPNPEWARLPPPFFTGKACKLRFPVTDPDRRATVDAEHMWVFCVGRTPRDDGPGRLVGLVDNTPEYALEWPLGTQIRFRPEEVEAVWHAGLDRPLASPTEAADWADLMRGDDAWR